MTLRYMTLTKNHIYLRSVETLDPNEEWFMCLIDLLDLENESIGEIVTDGYVAFTFIDWKNGDEMFFVVLKLNKAEYEKRVTESKQGYHSGVFWLLDDLFEPIGENDAVPSYENLLNQYEAKYKPIHDYTLTEEEEKYIFGEQ